MRPSSAPTDSSALSCFWAPLWIGCYDNAECGMRSAEWLGEVDQRGRRRVRAGTDLPLKFRNPHSALRIRRGRPARPPIRAPLRRLTGGGVEPVAGDFGHHQRLRRGVRRTATGDACSARRADLAAGLEARLATTHPG